MPQQQEQSGVNYRAATKVAAKNIVLFSCTGRQALLSDMRFIILLLIMKEEQAFLYKYIIFRKLDLKFFKNIFEKYRFIFL